MKNVFQGQWRGIDFSLKKESKVTWAITVGEPIYDKYVITPVVEETKPRDRAILFCIHMIDEYISTHEKDSE